MSTNDWVPGLTSRRGTSIVPSCSAAASALRESSRSAGSSRKSMTQPPYAEAERVYCIVDNGSSHRGQRSIERFRRRYRRYPELILVHLPIHASWLNQIEIYFSIVQRKVLTPNDFNNLGQVPERLLAFQRHYQTLTRPFEWTFTRRDLAKLLAKLASKTDAI